MLLIVLEGPLWAFVFPRCPIMGSLDTRLCAWELGNDRMPHVDKDGAFVCDLLISLAFKLKLPSAFTSLADGS